MTRSPYSSDSIPMMFRAQIDDRCQLQRLNPDADEQDAERWADEWVERTYPDAPEFSDEVQTRTYSLSWRFVTNSGQDDGMIRPVIGAKGWPFYPGSSMKGAFRQACQNHPDRDRFCGSEDDLSPGILRFHGGYPTDESWTQDLVDIIHPQQNWQVKDSKQSKAFIQMSLHRPTLKFGISSTMPLSEEEWQTIWQLWEKAMGAGLGCRVSAGYGQPQQQSGDIIYRTRLKGQGQAAKLITEKGEFRPNIFRAAIRGHALRIFGGLTNADAAEDLVDTLFGGIRRGNTKVGLLSMAFQIDDAHSAISKFGQRSFEVPTYNIEGQLLWMLTQPLPTDERKALTQLIEALTRFAMVLGGFGKSWRRVDHRLIYPSYYDQGDKPLIGCHWQWLGKRAQIRDVRFRKLEQFGAFIAGIQKAAQQWMQLQNVPPNPAHHAHWREAWHPDNVEVWGRLTKPGEGIEDSIAIEWLHGPYRQAYPSARIREGSIYQSSLTGKMGHIGRIWHRMYPYIRLVKDPQNPQKPMPRETDQYFELLTLFPDNKSQTLDFLDFLDHQQQAFQPLWP